MIDTDKYEGHLAYLDNELWAFTDFMDINATHEERCATDALLNDAPLLLAEVKRLREQNKLMVDYFRYMRDGGFTDADWRTVNEWIGDEEE
jgi:hypothetical protein